MNTVAISPFNNLPVFGKASTKTNQGPIKKDENPISRKGEAAKLTLATFIGGLGLAGRCLLELIVDGDFALDEMSNRADKIVDKTKKEASSAKKDLCKIGAFFAILAAALSGFALLYTAFKAPKIAYDSKVNAYKNGKEMDVYIKSNKAEKNLYTQLSETAKSASPKEKEQLKEQYVKMTVAKNQLPNLV